MSGRAVSIVGAGPAGLIAAERLAEAGFAVTVHDRMPSVGRKFLLAGRGGLNLTHSEPLERFLPRYGAAAKRVERLIAGFTPADLIAWAEGLGEPTFVGTSGRVFPKSFKASPLLRAWLRSLGTLGVKVETRREWLGFSADGDLRFATPEGEVVVPKGAGVILALGGASWPRMGSTGAWVPILRGLGVEVADFVPANAGLKISWSAHVTERFEGQPLKRVAASCGALVARGEALITAQGLEGGAVYAVMSAARDALARGEAATVTLDLRPDLTEEALAAEIAKARAGESTATILEKRAKLSPSARAVLREAGPLPREPWSLARAIKAVRLAVAGVADIDRAISSAGGVSWDELDENLMIKRLPGVFVAGEMIDWEAPTGGYLLQACFASGVAAAAGVIGRS